MREKGGGRWEGHTLSDTTKKSTLADIARNDFGARGQFPNMRGIGTGTRLSMIELGVKWHETSNLGYESLGVDPLRLREQPVLGARTPGQGGRLVLGPLSRISSQSVHRRLGRYRCGGILRMGYKQTHFNSWRVHGRAELGAASVSSDSRRQDPRGVLVRPRRKS